MDKEQIRKHTRAHLEYGIDECRWCFAVDLRRVKAIEIARYGCPDGTFAHFYCPRCGGEFSQYLNGWSEPYVKERIKSLHPELCGYVSEEHFREVNARVLYPDQLGDYLD